MLDIISKGPTNSKDIILLYCNITVHNFFVPWVTVSWHVHERCWCLVHGWELGFWNTWSLMTCNRKMYYYCTNYLFSYRFIFITKVLLPYCSIPCSLLTLVKRCLLYYLNFRLPTYYYLYSIIQGVYEYGMTI